MNTKQIDSLFTAIDEKSNCEFICREGKLKIKQSNEKRWREIGKIYSKASDSSKLIYKKFEKESGVFRKLDAWSVPSYVFKNVNYIWFITETFDYRINTKKVNKELLHFKKMGTELKVYIPRAQFKTTKL